MNYVSGPRLWPVTADNTTFGVWTGDWVASPQDDLVLIPRTEQNVYQRALPGWRSCWRLLPLSGRRRDPRSGEMREGAESFSG